MTSIGPLRSSAGIREILGMRTELDRLQQQLGTGRRADTFAELGGSRAPVLDARAKLSSLDSFDFSIQQVTLRLGVMEQSLTRMAAVADEQRGENLSTNFVPVDGRQSAQQKAALMRFQEVLGLLNQDVDGRHLFSGRATERAATATSEQILDGTPQAAGLRAVIDERTRADKGANGLGRLALAVDPLGTTVVLSDTASGPFGFKIASATSTIDNATVTESAGPPRQVDVAFTGVPSVGSSVTVGLTFPGTKSTSITLRASATTPRGEGTFTIGADAAETATNFRAALEAEIRAKVASDLVPASAMAAADSFFDIDDANPPARVDVITTPEAATALRAASTTDTVRWYVGDGGPEKPRATAVARIDTTMTVAYGARANEEGIREIVAALGVFAAAEFDPAQANTKATYATLSLEVRDRLRDREGQSITSLRSEIGVSQHAVKTASERHKGTRAMLDQLVHDHEGISQEEVASKMLALQTRLQVSYQATAMIAQMSLAQYLR